MPTPSTVEVNKIRACLLSATLLAAGAGVGGASCSMLSDSALGERKPCCDPRDEPSGQCERSLGYSGASNTFKLICACGVQDAEPGWRCATRLQVAKNEAPIPLPEDLPSPVEEPAESGSSTG